MDEKLKNYALFAEIVSAVAIIISLAFVVMELRNNTAAIKSSSAQATADASRNFLLNIALDEEFSRVFLLPPSEENPFSDLDFQRFSLVSYSNLIYYQNIWIQWTLGAIDDRTWQTYRSLICTRWNPSSKSVWDRYKIRLHEEFIAFKEDCST